MTVTRFFETLLVRDVFSHFVPGALIIIIIKMFGLDHGIVESTYNTLKQVIGDGGAFGLSALITYFVGYLSSTILFYFEGFINRFTRFELDKPTPEIIDNLRLAFGDWIEKPEKKSNWVYISKICQNYVEIKDSNFYFLKIDRLILLRNIEMGCAGVFTVLSIALCSSLTGWQLLYIIFPLLATALLFVSSRVLNRETTEQVFMSFYVLFREEKLRLEATKKDD
jgi:hypothetical protein